MNLRPYQQELVKLTRFAFASGAGSVCLQVGTGAGKTHTAAAILQSCVAAGMRCVFAAHLDTLITDTHRRLTEADVFAGFVQAGRPSSPLAPVQVVSLQTLQSRGELPPADFVVLDECHRSEAAGVRGILERYPRAGLLGLTATPQRGDGQPLGNTFNMLVCGPSNRWLTDNGYLVPCEVLAPPDVLEDRMAGDPVEMYLKHAPGTRAIVFASTVAEAQSLAGRFPLAACITGDTPREERERIYDQVRSGETKVLISVNVFTEGFDLPCIETVVLARLCGVTGSYLQRIGRGLRPSVDTGKTRCLVLDLCGSTHLHGLPDEDRAWSLDGDAVRRTEKLDAILHCKKCLAIFRPAAVCPRCGEETKGAARVPKRISRAEKLERLDTIPQRQRDAAYLRKLQWVAQHRVGLSGPRSERWALERFKKQFGREPVSA